MGCVVPGQTSHGWVMRGRERPRAMLLPPAVCEPLEDRVPAGLVRSERLSMGRIRDSMSMDSCASSPELPSCNRSAWTGRGAVLPAPGACLQIGFAIGMLEWGREARGRHRPAS